MFELEESRWRLMIERDRKALKELGERIKALEEQRFEIGGRLLCWFWQHCCGGS